MGDGPPVPGTDEIVVVKPPARTLCSSREHRRLGLLAEVIITFGQLGTAWQQDALWQTCWGKSYPLCGECWGCVRQVAEGRRPALAVMEYGWPGQRGAPGGRTAGPIKGDIDYRPDLPGRGRR